MSGPGDEDSAGKPKGLGPGLGAERLGLLALRWPVWCALAALAFSVFAALGVARINVDDSLSQLFRSKTPEFRQYEELSRRFPSSEFDVLIVIEGEKLLEREQLGRLRDFVTDVQLVDGVKGVISLFSARQAPRNSEIPPALFPPDLPEGDEYERLVEGARANEIIRGKLLSEDGRLALVVASLDREVVASVGLRGVVESIRETAATAFEGSGLDAQLSGAPVMQLEIRNAVERDRLVYNAIGFLMGCLVATIFFRKLSFIIIAAAPPLIAIPWSLGILGWMDFRLNMFLNVMTPLIMVMGFSDTMQITYAAREKLLEGASKKEALRSAIMVVGPACVVTVATAAPVVSHALLFAIGPDPHIRPCGRDLDAHFVRVRDRPVPHARHVPDERRGRDAGAIEAGRQRRERAAAPVRLGGARHDGPAAAVERPQSPDRCGPLRRVRDPGAALPARRPGARPRAGGEGGRAARRAIVGRKSRARACRPAAGAEAIRRPRRSM